MKIRVHSHGTYIDDEKVNMDVLAVSKLAQALKKSGIRVDYDNKEYTINEMPHDFTGLDRKFTLTGQGNAMDVDLIKKRMKTMEGLAWSMAIGDDE